MEITEVKVAKLTMLLQNNLPQYYAVVDLGSNSFHMLITCLIDNKITVIDKIKRKVRLASGLNKQNQLSTTVMTTGLNCLAIFAQHLSSIPLDNIRIVATATLRLATNRDDFLLQANNILPIPITLLTGEQEAATIYSGVAYTCDEMSKRLVIDIGGASTELIVGQSVHALHSVSLNIGCVTFNKNYFGDGLLSESNFNDAIEASIDVISPHANRFMSLGWKTVLGSSGIIQALIEILAYQNRPLIVTTVFLYEIQQQLIAFVNIDNIHINGLRADRIAVLASGLSILIALFECLKIERLSLSKGALREGLLFGMLPKSVN